MASKSLQLWQDITLATCRGWRSALNVLASSLDRVAAEQCAALGLGRPW
jgi:hypothetical protein